MQSFEGTFRYARICAPLGFMVVTEDNHSGGAEAALLPLHHD